MKKIVRVVWISTLTGLAFLSACLTQNGLTRRERKQLLKEREQVEMQLSKCQKNGADIPMHEDFTIEYMNYFEEKYALENKLDSINYRLGDSIDLDRNVRRRQILKRIDSLNFLVETYQPALVYGPPEMWDKDSGCVKEESDIDIWERELREAKAELDVFEHANDDSQQTKEQQLQEAEQRKLDSIQRKKELQRKQDSIRRARRDNERSCVYGPPPSTSTSTCGVSNADVKSTTTKLNDLVNEWSMASTPAEKAEKKASFDATVKSFDAKLNQADCKNLDPKLLKNYEFVKKLIK